MPDADSKLDRLLRSAARADEPEAEMPFGLDTRVVALARGGHGEDAPELMRLARRVMLGALAVAALASSAAYWQLHENEQLGEPMSNAYAIADSAIETEFFP